jgi:hemolysin III
MSVHVIEKILAQRLLSPREHIADGVIHAVGLVSGCVAAGILVGMTAVLGTPGEFAAVTTYAVGLIAMLGCSAAYNLARSVRLRAFLCRFDHAAIFAMIAGTYTPFTTLRLEGSWAIAMTALVWTVAALGMAIKLYRPRHFEGFFIALYLVLGWIGIVAIKPLVASLETSTLILLGSGGLLYTLGVVFHVWERLPFQKAVWHGFVLVAAGAHYAAVLEEILLARIAA